MRVTTKTSLAFGVSGLCVGWLVGLSVSPIVQVVVASMMGLAASAVAVASGFQARKPSEEVPEARKLGGSEVSIASNIEHPASKAVSLPDIAANTSLSAASLVMLCVGIGVGASVGIVARTHNWLGMELSASNSNVQAASSGPRPSPSAATEHTSNTPSWQIGGLYTAVSDIRAACAKLQVLELDALVNAAQTSTVCEISGCTSRETEPAKVKEIVDDICSRLR